MKKISLVSLFFLLGVILHAQQIMLTVSVDNSSPAVGEMIEVIVKTNINGNIQIAYPREFITGGGVMNGMSRQITNSSYTTIFYRSENGSFQKEGEFTIGPATIRKGNKSYTSNKIVVKVKNASSSSSSSTLSQSLPSKSMANKSAFGLIETNKSSVYIGEPISITARVFAQFEPKTFENYREYTSKGLPDKHKIPNPEVTNVELKTFQNKKYYSFSYDKSISFPAEAGTFSVQPFQLTLGHFFDQERISSEPTSITVKPLPSGSPASFKGSVGKMNVERFIRKTASKQGDVAIVSFVFSGYGNLHSIEIPDLQLPSSIQLYGDPIIKEEFEFTEKGAEGKLIIDYNIQFLDPGNLKIPHFDFSFFDLETEKFVEIQLDSIVFSVDRTPGFNKAKAKEQASLKLASKKILQESNSSFFTPKSMLIMGGIGFSLLALLFIIFKRKKKKEPTKDFIENAREGIPHAEHSSKESIVKKRDTFNLDLQVLASKMNDSEDYIQLVCESLDNWLEGQLTFSETKSLTRFEKINQLESIKGMEQKSKLVRDIFAKIDEARYGLKIDSFGCQQIQMKLEDLIKK
jgi:hypothetical protein